MITATQIITGSYGLAKTAINRLETDKPLPVGYIGWLGHNNLGDEAMFEAAMKLFGKDKFLHYSGARKEKILSGIGLSGRHYFSKVILGGGTLINSGYLATVRTALDSGLELMALGTGVGSNGFSNDRIVDIRDWGSLLKQFKRVGIRGPRSLQALGDIGIDHAEVVGDLALALTEDVPRAPGADNCYVLNAAMSRTGDPDFPRQFLLDELRSTVQRLAQLGWKPIPIAFCQADVEPTAYVAGAFGKQGVPVLRRHDEFFERIGHCHFLVGVRLHSAVLSSCIGVPPLLVGYRDKGADFMESMGLQNWLVDPYAAKTGELADKAVQLATNSSDLRETVLNQARLYRDRLQRYANHV
jgi:polysaccharide pyruvyl transferase WcaK-like protein